ncbi:MAG: phosphoribulokinase [Gammaproteobacteria bacterium]
MSRDHPIIAVTGSSGAGTTHAKSAFERIFHQEGIAAALVEGDSFHRFDRQEMDRLREAAAKTGAKVTHFGPEGNLFEDLEALFEEYGARGTGKRRRYVHTEEEARETGASVGTFTPWEPLAAGTDLLFYEGLHGGLVTERINVPRHVDLLIGVVPIINLEWMQKIHRDQAVRGYSTETATQMILRRMDDYVHYITPQFSRTHVNFQRIPLVDTSNPFAARELPSDGETAVVIHVQDRRKLQADFRTLLDLLDGSFMARPDTLVVPGAKYVFAMELIVLPVIQRLMAARAA